MTTPAACRDYLNAAIDGSGTSAPQRILRDRFVLLTDEQLVAVRDCVAATPSCDALSPDLCGASFRALWMVLDPDWGAPTCE